MSFVRPFGDNYFQQRSAAKNPLESAKLDGEFNALKEYLNSQLNFIQNVSEWNISQVLPTYISTTQFSLNGDVTEIYAVYRKIRVVIGSNDPVYSTVAASAYDGGTGKTTVTLLNAILAENITELAYGLLGADLSKSSFPANLFNVGVETASSTPHSVSRHVSLVLCDATSASMICNLLSYSVLGPGKLYIFRKIDTTNHTVTITPAGSEKIDGKDNVVLQLTGDTIIIMSKATTGWELVLDRVAKLPANFLPGAFGNLKIKNNSGSPQNKIDISADYVVVQDSSGNIIPLYNISHTVDFTATGTNALDSGTLTNSTWYYIWEIAKVDGTKAALGSTSSTAPQMPTDYTYKKLLGAIYCATGAFRNIIQANRIVEVVDNAVDMTGNIALASWTSRDITAYVPPIAVAAYIQGVALSTHLMVEIAWDNTGSQNKLPLVNINGAAVSIDGYVASTAPFRYVLKPTSVQTIYVKGYDGNDRGHLYCKGYEITI